MRALALALMVVACEGQPSLSGAGEPLRVREGVFHEGELPGGPDAAGPRVTAAETATAVVSLRQSAKLYQGRAEPTAYSVALRFVGLGTGYWVVPVGGPDPTFDNEATWSLRADFGDSIPAGLRVLRLVALDGAGRAGPWRDLRVCVVNEVEDGISACDPSVAPPGGAISLDWDSDVDLDLVVEAPDGSVIDARHPAGAGATLDRDSNANCALDGARRETVRWADAPPPGVYRVYVNLFSACGLRGARYRVSARRRTADGAALADFFTRDGALTDDAANGGASRGTFVAEVTFP